jgi:phosphoribosyl 1,2-cyclic phosphodiesterase
LLIDAGLSGRQIRQRLLSIGRTPENLHGILITHEHSDHIQGLLGLAAKLQVPIYCNRLTKEAIDLQLQSRLAFRVFNTGASFDIGDVVVDTFTIPHDAYDPVGFLLKTEAGHIGFLTDLGHATRLVMERVRSARVLLLETNHDMKLLQEDTRRPWSTKQRIMSRHGHLSNDAAADFTRDVRWECLEHLYLGHISSDCNRPELAFACVREALNKLGAAQVRLETASPTIPSSPLELATRVDANAAFAYPVQTDLWQSLPCK